MEYFTPEKMNEHITVIRSKSGELMYLIEGTNRALLMDTCVGIYGLREVVESITDKPYEVVLTHGHVDHAMGAPEFMDKKVYMSLKDLELYHSMGDIEGRMNYCKFSTGLEMDITEADFIPPTEVPFIDLYDGQEFDLGGVHVEMLAVPGHTQGSFALFIKEEKKLILGDAGNTFTFLFDPVNSSTVADYREMLLGLSERVEGKIDDILLCHHTIHVPTYLLDELIEVCDDILSGNTDDDPFEFMGEKGNSVIAKHMEFSRENGPHRADGKLANIIYNKNAKR